jgi:hypothetical protein
MYDYFAERKGEENQAYDNGKGIEKKGRDCGCTR